MSTPVPNVIPEPTAVALVHSIGLLFQQTSMYGPTHNVAMLAMHDALAKLETGLAMHGEIEIAIGGADLLINGAPLVSKDPSTRSLAARFNQLKIDGVAFLPGLDEAEFAIFNRILSSSPGAIAGMGGLRKALDSAGLRSIKLVNAEYRKVPEAPIAPSPPPPAPPTSTPSPPEDKVFSLDGGAGSGVIDLSGEMASGASAFSPAEPPQAPAESDRMQRRRENARKMADLLRATAALLENTGTLPPEIEQQQILSAIERILKHLETSSVETRKQISLLAGKVEADRQTIASIESAARRRGIGFNLTRKELLDHYAEINQEILQPVTVSAGALDLLLSGRCGALEPAQQELIRLAFEGMGRVNQLIAYTNRISGLPASLQPDAEVIRDSYA